MELTINSRKLKMEITFSRPGSGHIYVDLNGEPGTTGKQICEGGSLRGYTLKYSGNDYDDFEKICRQWYRAHIKENG